jgi:hypothetical protein
VQCGVQARTVPLEVGVPAAVSELNNPKPQAEQCEAYSGQCLIEGSCRIHDVSFTVIIPAARAEPPGRSQKGSNCSVDSHAGPDRGAATSWGQVIVLPSRCGQPESGRLKGLLNAVALRVR